MYSVTLALDCKYLKWNSNKDICAILDQYKNQENAFYNNKCFQ